MNLGHWVTFADLAGGQKFVAPILAFNMASTSWKAFSDQVQRFRDEADEEVKRILASNRLYKNALPENQVAVKGCVIDDIPGWHTQHDKLWERTRKWAWAMNITAFGFLYFEVTTPFSLLLAFPIPIYLWRKQRLKKRMNRDLDSKVTQSCQALEKKLILDIQSIVKPQA